MGLSDKYSSVIEKIKERIKNEDLITESTDIYKPYIHPCLTSSQIEDLEKLLKVKIPPFIVRLYTEIGNGGFGPSYGLLGLKDGAKNEYKKNAIEIYRDYMQKDPNDLLWNWPVNLIPLVHLGCGMFFCVDFSDKNGSITWFEPNPHEDGEAWDSSFIKTSITLDDLLSMWVSDEDYFSIMEKEYTNCFGTTD